ncbi:M15 family metallopeptidase [Woeseia oceani]|uniref:M15 family metallopeptidase n=1 Tax=Woeseia oceani TaxID=1548547 RepID=UPI0009F36490|nr:M15 family metallopeptidase [Woeseia oceani]
MKNFNVVLLACVLFASAYGCSQQSVRQDDGRDGFVYVHDVIPDVILDVRYHSNDNFMGTVVDGYHRDVILISKPAAAALSKVQDDLRQQGFGLKIFDGYRPQKAVNHFVRWSENPADRLTKQTYYPDLPKDRLFELGYIARKSGHTRGSTLDLTVVNLASGEELDMGSPWDFFGEVSHHDSPLVDSTATANRELLRQTMVRHGFLPYANEWWHYTLANEPYPDTYFDFNVE